MNRSYHKFYVLTWEHEKVSDYVIVIIHVYKKGI